ERLPVPVIVVGNRVAGGAGKTPTTLAIVAALQVAGWQPGIVSRGHGGSARAPMAVDGHADAGVVGDEPLLMQRRSGVPVWIGRDRAAAGRALLAAHPAVNVLVCDDGLQHLRLGRDIEVLVFDERGAGNGWLLPAGPLREPIDAPAAATQVVLYNAAQPSTALPGHCASRRLSGVVSLEGWWRGEPVSPFDTRGAALDALRTQLVTASAGIGQPQRFFAALREQGLSITAWRLSDHHRFATLPWPAEVRCLIVTEKDAVKLRPERLRAERPALQVWVAPLAFSLPEAFIADLLRALPAPGAQVPSTRTGLGRVTAESR
ncbi:MAG: tetraacyldisaccharide 4'-kinase, partial [Leptothrix sp. (in: b-proteobacteria)]